VVLPVRAALLNTDPALEEAARGLGLSRWRVFLRVTLPSLRPALAAGLLMTALYTLSDFGAVMVMRYNAFTRAIYVNYNSSFDRERAAVLALVLIALTLGLLWLERRATRRTRNYRIGTATPRKAQPIALGAWRIPALIFCALLVGVGVVLPFGVLIGWAVNPNVTSDVPLQLDAISANAISASAVTAVVAAAAAIPLALLAVRGSTRVQRLLASASYLGNVLPGVVIGLALVYFAANHAITLYQTFPLLILGYATRYITYSVSSTRSALTQISPALEEAARGLGLRPWQVAARVTAPLARAGILGGGALVFLNVMKELPTTLILAPIGYRTLATRIWTASESGTLALVGLPGLVLMAAAGLSMIVVLWRDDSRQRR
jgi:iron(III) transport system permease protein